MLRYIILYYIIITVAEIFRTRPDWPWGPPSLLHHEYRVISEGKAHSLTTDQ